MRYRAKLAAAITAAVCVSAPGAVNAQEPTLTPRQAGTPSSSVPEPPAVDPATMTELNRMAAYLQTLRAPTPARKGGPQ